MLKLLPHKTTNFAYNYYTKPNFINNHLHWNMNILSYFAITNNMQKQQSISLLT